jgi:transcriptional regulator with XRE-family HTH domain
MRREQSGLTRAQLACIADCSLAHLSNLEAGAVPRSSAVLDRVLVVLAELESAR